MEKKVGIFWVIKGMIFDKKEVVQITEKRLYDSEYEHFVEWDNVCAKFFSIGDFATYPRGRVMFDNTRQISTIFADKCISRDEIQKIAELFDCEKFEVKYDEHYQCDVCFYDNYFEKPQPLSINVLRGADEIGSNLIEVVSDKGTKILLECGIPLNESEQNTKIENQVLKTDYDAVIVTHYHSDHAGMVDRITAPIFMGEYCKRVIEYQREQKGLAKIENIKRFKSEKQFAIKDIRITPYLVDHSAYDSYMLEIEKKGYVALYTGDFRDNGRKNFDHFLAKLPFNIDLLISENTNNENSDPLSEMSIELKAVELMKGDKPVFVLQASPNIDRYVSFFKASLKSKRLFLIDNYQAGLVGVLGESIPKPIGYSNVYCYVSKKVEDADAGFEIVQNLKRKKKVKTLRSLQGERYCMIVRTSSIGYLKKLNEQKPLAGATLIYSMWSGYKKNEDMQKFLGQISDMGIEVVSLHTAGHAGMTAKEKLRRVVNARETIFVHGNKGENQNENE